MPAPVPKALAVVTNFDAVNHKPPAEVRPAAREMMAGIVDSADALERAAVEADVLHAETAKVAEQTAKLGADVDRHVKANEAAFGRIDQNLNKTLAGLKVLGGMKGRK